MHPSIQRPVWRLGLVATTVAACLLTANPAHAQVGTAVQPITVEGDSGFAYIGFGPSPNQWTTAESLGGVTLFAAYAPNGPVLVRLPFLPPFESDELLTPPGWGFPGVPPGTYYVALVYGIVASPNIPAEHWTQLDVPGGCTTAPGIGLLNRDLAGVAPDAVRVFMSAFGGCATSYLVEAGTSPGATNVASFEQAGVLLSAGGVPPGNYYMRVRGKNQFGVGPYSAVLPVSVPGCPTEGPQEVDDLTATVVGNSVTLTWTPPVAPPGRPITYYELALLHAAPPATPAPRILLPGAVSTITATVPSGTYRLLIYAGNACNSESGSPLVTFTVP